MNRKREKKRMVFRTCVEVRRVCCLLQERSRARSLNKRISQPPHIRSTSTQSFRLFSCVVVGRPCFPTTTPLPPGHQQGGFRRRGFRVLDRRQESGHRYTVFGSAGGGGGGGYRERGGGRRAGHPSIDCIFSFVFPLYFPLSLLWGAGGPTMTGSVGLGQGKLVIVNSHHRCHGPSGRM